MKDNEFNEKFPSIIALIKSTDFFNKRKYHEAIEILEDYIKTDPKNDLKTNSRRELFHNLSVNYVMIGDFDKAIDSIHKKQEYVNIKSYHQMHIEWDKFTNSQVKALEINYEFNNFSYFQKASKQKKMFNKFVDWLGLKLSEIEKIVKQNEFSEASKQLDIFLKSITYSFFDGIDIFKGRIEVHDKKLYNLIVKSQQLQELCHGKEVDHVIELIKQFLKDAAELVKQGRLSEAEEQLNDFINNFKIPTMSTTARIATESNLYDNNEIYAIAKDLLDIVHKQQNEATPEAKALREILERTIIGGNDEIFSIACCIDGKNIISGSEDTKIWDYRTGNLIATLDGRSDYVNSITISPDGNYIISGSRNKTLRVWNYETKELVWSITENIEDIYSVAISPDGQYIVAGLGTGHIGAPWDSKIKMWDFSTHELVRVFEGHNSVVNTVVISPDSKYLVSGAKDIKIWEFATGKLIHSFNEGYQINKIIMGIDGKSIISASYNAIEVWDLPTGKKINSFSHGGGGILSVAISPDGNYMVSGSGWHKLEIWNFKTGDLLKEIDVHTRDIRSVVFSLDGNHVISGSDDKTIKIWDFNNILEQPFKAKELEAKKKEQEAKDKEALKKSLEEALLKVEKLINERKYQNLEVEIERIQQEAEKLHLGGIRKKARNLLRTVKRNIQLSQKKMDDGEYSNLENLINQYNLMKISSMDNLTEASTLLSNRNDISSPLNTTYITYEQNEESYKKITNLAIKLYSQHLDINPFEINIEFFPSTYNNYKNMDIMMIENYWKNNIELQNLFKKLVSIDYDAMIDQELKKIAEETKELEYDVPVENMYSFLLDFSNVFTNNPKIDEISNENEYTLKSSKGNLYFKFIEKELNKKIVYKYDFMKNSQIGEKGKFTIEFVELSPGKVKLKTRNEIEQVASDKKIYLSIENYLGKNLGALIDLVLAKILAKQVQTIFNERSFDDLTMGNHRILQAKLNAMGRDINKLSSKFFEVKAPLTMNSFSCSECGATLNITSKEEKFVICEHCDTPFLMEWQK